MLKRVIINIVWWFFFAGVCFVFAHYLWGESFVSKLTYWDFVILACIVNLLWVPQRIVKKTD